MDWLRGKRKDDTSEARKMNAYSYEWVAPATGALLLWGGWGFFEKLATNHISPKNVYLFTAAGPITVAVFILISQNFRAEFHRLGTVYAVIAGLSGSIGGLLFVHALRKGKASIVITVTALYPLVAILLSIIFLREEITIKQGIGIILALIAMMMLAS